MSAYLNLIAGSWQPSSGGRTFENRNPADVDDLIGTFPESSAAAVASAIDAARATGAEVSVAPIPGSGHNLMAEHPEETLAALREWLARVTAPQAKRR